MRRLRTRVPYRFFHSVGQLRSLALPA
jgi:hypothetical protein